MNTREDVSIAFIVKALKKLVDSRDLSRFNIHGELSNVRCAGGHYYFDLKDREAQMSCTLWRSMASRLSFVPVDGMAVVVNGNFNIYEKRGSLSLNVQYMEEDGIGDLHAELERRRARLAREGYFNPEHKKPRPAWINSIGVVTGAGAAALKDVMKTIKERWPMLEVHLYPSLVQGERAPESIRKALKKADQGGHDAILLVRGGGSLEDLFCFNDEELIKDIYHLNTFIVTGVGHEIDTTLADLAADVRALTPTAAAQFITPDQNEIKAWLQAFQAQSTRIMQKQLQQARSALMYIQGHPYMASPISWAQSKQARLSALQLELEHKIETIPITYLNRFEASKAAFLEQSFQIAQRKQKLLTTLSNRLLVYSPRTLITLEGQKVKADRQKLNRAMQNYRTMMQNRLNFTISLLQAASPQASLKKGYVLPLRQGKVVRYEQIEPEQSLSFLFDQGIIKARILAKKSRDKSPQQKEKS